MDETTATIKTQRFTTAIGTLTSYSPDNSPLPTLPFHLLEEILCRLPVKSLLQLRCMCKSWKSLISDDPKFAKKHLHMSLSSLHQRHRNLIVNSIDSLYLSSTYCNLPISSVFNNASKVIITQSKHKHRSLVLDMSRRLPLNICHDKVVAVGSCHGIVWVPIQDRILFWNPSIGKYKLSPIFEYSRFYGFGYDDLNDKYKVVAISYYVDESVSNNNNNNDDDDDDEDVIKTKVMVHTLGTNCWRRIQEFPCGRGFPIEKSSKFVGGSVHWLTSKDQDEDENNPLFFIVSLDLRSESYQEISQPDYGEVSGVTLTLGVSRDCLCIFAHAENYIDVWCMKEYGKKESWSKLFSIPFTTKLRFYRDIEVVYVYEDEQVLLRCKRVHKLRLVVYDSKSDTFKHPGIENLDIMLPIDYVESLVTPWF